MEQVLAINPRVKEIGIPKSQEIYKKFFQFGEFVIGIRLDNLFSNAYFLVIINTLTSF